MKKHIVRGAIGFGVAAIAVVAVALSIGPTGSSAADGDHWIDNLGDGTTALEFDGNSSEDCTSDAFLEADYDLWHFVVNQATDPDTILTWNATNSVWSDPSEVTVVDVTEDYGSYTSGDGTKHLWIATTPVGATLVSAYLDYEGEAGRENLSHACGRSSTTPSIEIGSDVTYDMTWDWELDKSVVWRVNPAGGYTLDYSIEANRSDDPRLVPMTLHVTDGVAVTPSSLELTDLDVTFTQGTYTQPCDVNLAELTYDCEIDVSRISVDPATGRPTGTGTLSASATHSGGTLTDTAEFDFGTVEPTTVHAETASITDDYATPGNMADDLSTEESELDYSLNWAPSGTTCRERTNVATLLIDDPAPETENPTDSVTVHWCPPLPGLTIGFWGNKTGAPQVVANFVALKATYPNALGLAPTLGSTSAVRNFFRNASCSGTCASMFAAQFLATAMNATDPVFADQSVMFEEACMTVSELLVAADAGATGATKEWYSRYKTILDDINNSRQTTCLSVVD